jgi:hypothetical protein
MVGKNAFLIFSNAQNENEWKDGTKSEELKPQFSQVEWDLNLQKCLNQFPFHIKSTKEKNNYDSLCLCLSIVCTKSKKRKTKKTIKKIIKFYLFI